MSAFHSWPGPMLINPIRMERCGLGANAIGLLFADEPDLAEEYQSPRTRLPQLGTERVSRCGDNVDPRLVGPDICSKHLSG